MSLLKVYDTRVLLPLFATDKLRSVAFLANINGIQIPVYVLDTHFEETPMVTEASEKGLLFAYATPQLLVDFLVRKRILK